MKKLLFGAALLSIAMNCPAETKQALTLHLESGASIVYYLDTEPSIGFEGQTMVVTVDNEATGIPMEDVERWEIGYAEYTEVGGVAEGAGVAIGVYGNTLTVNNPGADLIVVYSLGGQTVASSSATEASFTLPRGIYVVTIANNTYKIAIR